jgi:hypothetical protein
MARRWLLHGGAAVRTFWEKQENLGMRQNSGNSAGILVRLQNFAIFHANSYTLSLKLTQRFPSEILPSGLRPKSDKFRQGVLVESDVHDSDGSGSESDDMDDDAIQEMVNYARANGHYSSEINALLSARERAQVARWSSF